MTETKFAVFMKPLRNDTAEKPRQISKTVQRGQGHDPPVSRYVFDTLEEARAVRSRHYHSMDLAGSDYFIVEFEPGGEWVDREIVVGEYEPANSEWYELRGETA